jgi:hypothetical protein
MGLCCRRSTIWQEMPNVSVETRTREGVTTTIYHTPEGEVSTRIRHHSDRINDNQAVELEGMIKSLKDYDPVLFMLDDTRFGIDPAVYHNTVRDFGTDGIFRDWALDHEAVPYGATKRYFGELYGLEQWVYHQRDYPDHFAKLVEAQTRRDERRLALVADSPAEFLGFGWLEGLWGPEQFRRHELPFYQKWIPYLQGRGKICALHCDVTRDLESYKQVIAETGVAVVEAYTPPPVSNLPLPAAREAWGRKTVIWLNFPETIFWMGREKTFEYTRALLKSATPGDALVISFTEMGIWGGTEQAVETAFKEGTVALMEAIEKYGNCPIPLCPQTSLCRF